ncbi:MAG: hypothetical protein AABW56_02090 [Nanoarchaeota archaeon]
MVPNCLGCRYEFEEGIKYLRKGFDVCLEGYGERRHLFITVLNKNGEIILG